MCHPVFVPFFAVEEIAKYSIHIILKYGKSLTDKRTEAGQMRIRVDRRAWICACRSVRCGVVYYRKVTSLVACKTRIQTFKIC